MKKDIAATIHFALDEVQREQIDRFCEEHSVPTRTAVVDEALGELLARRKSKFSRTYGRVTGPGETPRRRSTDK